MLIGFVDRPLSEYLHNLDQRDQSLIDVFRVYTDFGKSKWYLWPSAIGALICAIGVRLKSFSPKTRKRFYQAGEFLLFLFVCVALAGIITDIIKPILGRGRPVELTQEGFYAFHPISLAARWNSMPSGHATAAVTVALVIARRFRRLCIPAFVFGFVMALSRIMVNAHYLSDVIAGGVVGFLTIKLILWLKTHSGICHIEKRIFPIDGRTTLR